jgi:hypothetical protein
MAALSSDAALTVVEQAKLENYETVIEEGQQTFLNVGRALAGIRDDRLYRLTHETFDDYCQDRWGFEKSYAHKLLRATATVARIEAEISEECPIRTPELETHVRPLTRLPEDKQAEAWREAVETAEDGKVTAAHVEAVVARMLPEKEAEPVTLARAIRALRASIRRAQDKWPAEHIGEFGKVVKSLGAEIIKDGGLAE